MKPFYVLLGSLLLSLSILRLGWDTWDIELAMRIALSVMLIFTAIGHFVFSEGMSLMIPKKLPYKLELVYITGVIEVLAAVGLHLPSTRMLTGGLLIAFFILVLPSNIKAAIDKLDYQNPQKTGKGLRYLWFRVPLQLLFIFWVYFSALKI